MSTPTIAEPEAVNFETQFHIDKDVNDPENYLVIHELMGRGQLLNAYEVRSRFPLRLHFGAIRASRGRVRASRAARFPDPDPSAKFVRHLTWNPSFA